MGILNLLKSRLRNNQLAWCIGIPWTKEQFLECCNKESDFIDSLEMIYGVYDHIILWEYYRETADKLKTMVNYAKRRNVCILPLLSSESMQNACCYENIIFTVHHHRMFDALDFMGTLVSIDNFVNMFPCDYSGTLDISSCYSAGFQQKLKLHIPYSIIIATNTESSLELRLFIYKCVVRKMIVDSGLSFLDVYRTIAAKVVMYGRNHCESGEKEIFLGGKVLDTGNKMPQSASVFAPSEITKNDILLVQVYVFSSYAFNDVVRDAKKTDEESVERSRTILDLKLKKGDMLSVSFDVEGMNGFHSQKTMIWQNNYSKCGFFVDVPKGFVKPIIAGVISFEINGALVGNMCFVTRIVAKKKKLVPNVDAVSKSFRKVFISYSHEDTSRVQFMHEAYLAMGVDHFFDRKYLRGGDVFPEEIRNYINDADLFVLCWSENASKSEYVNLERTMALSLAYPHKTKNDASISIYPLSIEPKTELPSDMKNIYHFVELDN